MKTKIRIGADAVVTGRMIAEERKIPLSSVYAILKSKRAPDPLLDSMGIRFYAAKAIDKFFAAYKPGKPGPKKRKRAMKRKAA